MSIQDTAQKKIAEMRGENEGDAHKIISFYPSISFNPFSFAITSPLFTL